MFLSSCEEVHEYKLLRVFLPLTVISTRTKYIWRCWKLHQATIPRLEHKERRQGDIFSLDMCHRYPECQVCFWCGHRHNNQRKSERLWAFLAIHFLTCSLISGLYPFFCTSGLLIERKISREETISFRFSLAVNWSFGYSMSTAKQYRLSVCHKKTEKYMPSSEMLATDKFYWNQSGNPILLMYFTHFKVISTSQKTGGTSVSYNPSLQGG